MSSGQLIRPELARAYEQYYGLKGGEAPGVPSEMVPVVVFDDASAPFPPYRRWMMGGSAGPGGAGVYQYVGIINADAEKGSQRSAVILDELWLRNMTDDGGFLMGISQASVAPILATGPVRDVISDKELQATIEPIMYNVKYGSVGNPSNGIVNTYLPGAGIKLTAKVSPGAVLGPGWQFIWCNQFANQTMEWFARGRYYPSV